MAALRRAGDEQNVGGQYQQPGQRDLSRGGAVCLRDVGDHWVGANLLVLLTRPPERAKRHKDE
jgi:hypothetical protein